MRRAIIAAAIVIAVVPVGAGAAASPLTWSGQTWNVYNSTGALGQHWIQSDVKIGNSGRLNLHMTPDGRSGGVGDRQWFTYGKVTARFRITRGTGKYVFLLFGKPRSGGHADEIDFAESKSTEPNRTILGATLHYGAANTRIHTPDVSGDFRQWHTAGVIWKRGQLRFLLDGKVRATITSHVPSGPMHLTIQTESAGSVPAAPSGGPSTLQVSRVTR